ncbi:heterokaryon incompatibility protein-domain-containing protein [Podospora appendiculata]|uniref:Heterokaryon incompatibility protein-domain-containing protein n=1 Tax=Podospora appendiculata TaxID=314037 RepID=A0AAE0XGG8_9PEZI|nr:heterokaryon incompatibility protein-domain-containing protein [Podospora appendiculata]
MSAHQLFRPIEATDFRVVHLLPGKFDDEIRCVLETRPSGVKTRYEAISYQWGDCANTKPIRIAHLDSSNRHAAVASPNALTSNTLKAAAEQYGLHLRLISWCLGTWLLWLLISPLPVGPPSWLSWIPRDVYIAVLCMMCGAGPVGVTINAVKLLVEVAKTKPWLLVRDFDIRRTKSLDFGAFRVTTNLELALRYLRRERRPRTLWIDAMCINQADEDEKKMQIQRMDLVYANASSVLIWLGGYHGIENGDTCEEQSVPEDGNCVHRRQIKAAFHLSWCQSGWRNLLPWYFHREKERQVQEALAGLCDIYARGWWNRLWVIQEVALATGRVEIQCGHTKCEYPDFRSAQLSITRSYPGNKALKRQFGPSERIGETIRHFGYSPFHDREGDAAKILSRVLSNVWGQFSNDSSLHEIPFHEEAFVHRLHRVLVKTAGQFQCRDDRDRLYAVLGTAGGAKTGSATMLAGFMGFIGSHATSSILARLMDPLVSSSARFHLKLVRFTLGVASSLWTIFYDSRAKHWTINRPEYIVTGYRGVLDAVTGGPEKQHSRVDFFTGLARYLGTETGSLAFLDAAACGEDADEGMPSWVPNWKRVVGEPAYEFLTRFKENSATDTFRFVEDGMALELLVRSRGAVHSVQPTAELNLTQSAPWHKAFERCLALPIEGRQAVKAALELIHEITTTSATLNGAEEELLSLSVKLVEISLETGAELLSAAGPVLVHSLNKGAGEMGYLRAGEVARGDRIVFVPGCFHHLALRRLHPHTQPTAKGRRWKLVGLLTMGLGLGYKSGCTKSEWAQYRKDGEVFKYTIV